MLYSCLLLWNWWFSHHQVLSTHSQSISKAKGRKFCTWIVFSTFPKHIEVLNVLWHKLFTGSTFRYFSQIFWWSTKVRSHKIIEKRNHKNLFLSNITKFWLADCTLITILSWTLATKKFVPTCKIWNWKLQKFVPVKCEKLAICKIKFQQKFHTSR